MFSKNNISKAGALVAFLLLCSAAFAQNRDAIRGRIEAAMDENKVVGMSVAVVKDGQIVFSDAYGKKDLQTGEPLTTNDIYRIASISKSFSGASIMQLMEQGKVKLSDDVSDIIGFEVRNPRYPDIPITVGMLLSHTSSMLDAGLPYNNLDAINPAITSEKDRMVYWAEYAPGTGYKYCNRALNLTGCLIEKLSGERFDNYVRQHILLPLGIENAGFNIDSLDASTFASIYSYNESTGAYARSEQAYARRCDTLIALGKYRLGYDAADFSPTGGMKISAENLAKWMMVFMNHGVGQNGAKIMTPESVATMMHPHFKIKDIREYCLTLNTQPYLVDGYTLVGHTGGAYGLESAMYFDPRGNWGITVICASSKGATTEMGVSCAFRDPINILFDEVVKSPEMKAAEAKADHIREHLEQMRRDANVPAMAVAVVKGNEIIYQEAVGVRDLATQKPLEKDDIFRLASLSKSFTGASMMQMVEQGKVKLSDDVSKIVGFKVRNPRYPKNKITVAMLLSHTSGIIDGGLPYGSLDYLNPKTADKETLMKVYGDWRPGEKYKYSNRGLNLAGTVLEIVSGERFDEYVRHHILLPQGMYNAGYNVDTLINSKIVTLYNWNSKTKRMAAQPKAYDRSTAAALLPDQYRFGYDTPGWSPTGGMKMAVGNLAHWVITLKNGGLAANGNRIISEESYKQMTTKQVPEETKTNYGYTLCCGKSIINHSGSAHGLKSFMQWYRDRDDYGFAVICSGHDADHTDIARDVVNYLRTEFKKAK